MNSIKHQLKTSMLLLAIAALIFSSCDDNETVNVPMSLNFTNTEVAVSSSDNEVEVGVTLSRDAENDGVMVLNLESSALTYGEDADYYTVPAAVDGSLSLPYQVGDAEASFMVHAGSGLNIEEDRTIVLTLQVNDSDDVAVGDSNTATVTFTENFIAPSGTIEFNGGDGFPNQAFVDLSKLRQTTVDKYTWDLGFYNADGEYNVILNSSAHVMARALDAQDIDQVSAADTTGYAADMRVPNTSNPASAAWIDNHTGDLSETAFGEISSTDEDNKVFIIKRDGEGRNWKKVRVLVDGENYTLQYADISATTHTSVTITKDEAYNFSFFDLDNGAANVQPEKDSWDLMYSSYSVRLDFGDVQVPYGYSDYITSNRNGVSVASVSTDDFTYEEFNIDDVNSDDLVGDNIAALGSTWRTVFGGAQVYNDIFYVIKDVDDNYYKLKFNRLESEEGVRGFAQFSFELLD